MTRKTYGIIGLAVLMFIFTMRGMFKVSTDDIDTNKILEQEKIKVEETLSGLNSQLSGYSSGWLEQERIIVNAKAEQKKIEEKANTVRYRKRIYENKKTGLDMILGTGEVKKEIKNEQAINLPKTTPKLVAKVGAAYIPTTGMVGIKGFPKDSMATLVMTKAKNLRGIEWALTLYGENGSFGIDRQSECMSDGVRERSFGFCQLMEKYHAPFIWNTGYKLVGKIYVVDPMVAKQGGHTDKFMNWEKQVEYCTEVRDDAKRKGTMPFYANGHWKTYLPKVIYY